MMRARRRRGEGFVGVEHVADHVFCDGGGDFRSCGGENVASGGGCCGHHRQEVWKGLSGAEEDLAGEGASKRGIGLGSSRAWRRKGRVATAAGPYDNEEEDDWMAVAVMRYVDDGGGDDDEGDGGADDDDLWARRRRRRRRRGGVWGRLGKATVRRRSLLVK